MKNTSAFAYFMALGLFWGVSPSAYKQLSLINMPVLHTIFFTGIAVGAFLFCLSFIRSGFVIDRRLVFYGLGCASLMNVPFALNLYLAAYVPPTELAIIITLSPFFSYGLDLVLGKALGNRRKFFAIFLGFVSTAVLILTRGDDIKHSFSLVYLAALGIPLLYSFYNAFSAMAWPNGADTAQAGAFESVFSGLLALPFLLFLSPFGAAEGPSLAQHWILLAVSLMWIFERLAYFKLIVGKGAVYTVQATYVSTPAAVIIAAVFFGGAVDVWLWVSLAVLMAALYLNNTQSRQHPN
jgi:drug/metabolite transporter (DMT)-like permease